MTKSFYHENMARLESPQTAALRLPHPNRVQSKISTDE